MSFHASTRVAIAIVFLYGCVCCVSSFGQTYDAFPHKFDEFEELRTSDVKPRLDNFAIELNRLKDVRGYIVGYWPIDRLRGSLLRTLHGYKAYLVNTQGILADRVSVIDAEGKQWFTELWLVPYGAGPPKLMRAISPVAAERPVQFDTWLGPGCESQYTLVLEDPEDSVEFFAGSLRAHPKMKAYVVMHPSTRGPLGEAQRLAAFTTRALTQNYGIPAERIITNISSPRRCLEMNYWLVPQTLLVPIGSEPEVVFQAPLINEAEQKEYKVRRVEFSGNEHTRDQLLRRRILLQEGDNFTRAILRQSLESLSRFKGIRPVGLEDVEVYLRSDEKLIDMTIHINERRRN